MLEEDSMTLEEFDRIKPCEVLARHRNGTIVRDEKIVDNYS